MPLARQSTDPRYANFRENARWTQSGVVFVAIVAADPMTSSQEQFSAYIKQKIARWSKVVRTAGLRAD